MLAFATALVRLDGNTPGRSAADTRNAGATLVQCQSNAAAQHASGALGKVLLMIAGCYCSARNGWGLGQAQQSPALPCFLVWSRSSAAQQRKWLEVFQCCEGGVYVGGVGSPFATAPQAAFALVRRLLLLDPPSMETVSPIG